MSDDDILRPSDEAALAKFEPQYAMVATTEAGYLQIAAKIAASGLLPKGMSETQAAICMMAGGEYGVSPLKAINGFAVINGRPAPFGVLLRGICEDATWQGDLTGCLRGVGEMKFVASDDDDGAGEVEAELYRAFRRAVKRRLARFGWVLDGGKWRQEDGAVDVPDNLRVGFAVVKRAGRPVRVELFDSQEAHAARLLSKSGPWSDYPQRMLEARAITFALRALYADKLSGIGYTAEEMDVIDTTATEVPTPRVSSALDSLIAAPRMTAATPAVADADFTETPSAAPVADIITMAKTEPPPAKAERPVAPAAAPTPVSEPGGDAPPPTEWNDAAPAGESPAPVSTEGAKALKSACDMIRAGGGDIKALSSAASERALGEVKSSRAMTDQEKARVATEMARAWTEEKRQREEAARRPAAAPADSDVDF